MEDKLNHFTLSGVWASHTPTQSEERRLGVMKEERCRTGSSLIVSALVLPVSVLANKLSPQ